MNRLPWFDRTFTFGLPAAMLPFYLERLEGSIYRVEAKVNGVSDEVLSEKYNGKWSIKQQIGHLSEVGTISDKRIDEMTSGVEIMSPAVYEPLDYSTWPIEKVVKLFRDSRLVSLAKYKSIAEADLFKTSTHPRLKVKMTPVDLAYFDAEHDDHHLLKVSDIIAEHA